PRYLRMIAKEARLWPDQLAGLDQLARELNRERGRGNGERITSNTLLRLAAGGGLQGGGDPAAGGGEAGAGRGRRTCPRVCGCGTPRWPYAPGQLGPVADTTTAKLANWAWCSNFSIR